jgi:hypothetical protein
MIRLSYGVMQRVLGHYSDSSILLVQPRMPSHTLMICVLADMKQ